MEGRWLLSAVNIDRSGDPSADTITVGTSGSNTVIDVNGSQVYSGASSSISSLSITGTAYNDKIEFNYDGGNPVPDGTIGVSGGGGTNELDVTGNSNFTLANYVQLWGNISSTISYGYIQTIVATAASPSDQANLEAAGSSAGKFYGHLETNGGAGGPDAIYQANDGSYHNEAKGFNTVYAFSSNTNDVAYLDDDYAGVNNATAHPTIGWFAGSTFSDTVETFAHVNFTSGDTQDQASLDDQNNTSAATASYNPMNATYGGPGYQYTAANFATTTLRGYNSSDTANLGDTGTQGTYNSYNTYSQVYGTDNGQNYDGYAYFPKVWLNAAQKSDVANWYDYAGGASVVLNSYNQPYITFANGATATGVGFPSTPYNSSGTITADNFSNPVVLDYANASALPFVLLGPNWPNAPWQVNPHA